MAIPTLLRSFRNPITRRSGSGPGNGGRSRYTEPPIPAWLTLVRISTVASADASEADLLAEEAGYRSRDKLQDLQFQTAPAFRRKHHLSRKLARRHIEGLIFRVERRWPANKLWPFNLMSAPSGYGAGDMLSMSIVGWLRTNPLTRVCACAKGFAPGRIPITRCSGR